MPSPPEAGGADRGTLNYHWCRHLVRALAAAGVRRAVISPGSRSTPLVLALDAQAGITLTVIPDERSAAFFALGWARATGVPAVVVATSGSAPANWYPAVLEAREDAVPLLLVSADRPPERVGWGANQTTDQVALFGSRVQGFFPVPVAAPGEAAARHLIQTVVRAVERARWPAPGPVHLNVPLDEPLVPGAPPGEPEVLPVPTAHDPVREPDPAVVAGLAERLAAGEGVMVCGRLPADPEAAAALRGLARRLGCPLIADPLSGLRFGRTQGDPVCTRYDAWMRDADAARLPRPDWVLQFGRLPVSKALLAWLEAQPPDRRVLVSPGDDWCDPGHGVGELIRSDPARLCACLGERLAGRGGRGELLARFQGLDDAAEGALAAMPAPPVEAALLPALAEAVPEGGVLFLGNSLPVREADAFLAGGSRALVLAANRGVSGIDGNVSTAAGMAAHGPGGIALVGDLTLWHDMNGLLAVRGLPLALVVVDNGGGGIFEYLPQAGLEGFERYWLTPTGVSLEAVADLYGLAFTRTADPHAAARAAGAGVSAGVASLVALTVDRRESASRHREWWRAVAPGSS